MPQLPSLAQPMPAMSEDDAILHENLQADLAQRLRAQQNNISNLGLPSSCWSPAPAPLSPQNGILSILSGHKPMRLCPGLCSLRSAVAAFSQQRKCSGLHIDPAWV